MDLLRQQRKADILPKMGIDIGLGLENIGVLFRPAAEQMSVHRFAADVLHHGLDLLLSIAVVQPGL